MVESSSHAPGSRGAPESGRQSSAQSADARPLELIPEAWNARVRNEPISGLWFFALIASLVILVSRNADTSSSVVVCPSGSLGWPWPTAEALSACAERSISWWFFAACLPAVLAYSWFFRECTRWIERCLNWDRVRRIARLCQPWLIVATAVVDILACLSLAIARPEPWARWVTVALLVVRFGLLALNGAFAATALFVGLRRFALPWTMPPAFPVTVPAAAPGSPAGPPRPIRTVPDTDRWYRFPGPDKESSAPDLDVPAPADYAIGLSGGGVRSAAFCAGVLQALNKTPWSPREADYLATVSGGGYVGVSSQMLRYTSAGTDALDPYAGKAPETTQFAQRHRYLGDDALTRAQLLLALLNGWVLNALLIVGPLVLVGFGVALLPDPSLTVIWILGSAGAFCLLLAAALLWLSEAEGRRDTRLDHRTEEIRRARNPAGSLVIAGVLALAVVLPFSWYLLWIPPLLGLAGLGLYWVDRSSRTPLLALSRMFFVAAWVCVGLIVICGSAGGGLGNPTSWSALQADLWWTGGMAAGAVVLGMFWWWFDQTSWSPHPYYKARLAGTFAVRRIVERNSAGNYDGVQLLPYDEYTYLDEWAAPLGDDQRPQLLVCATANAEDRALPPKNTRAIPFVFAHDLVGSPELGWWRTADFRRCLGRQLAGDGTLQAATAISGAAVASGLGVKGRIPSVGTALALLNARLGVWLPNPNSATAAQDWPESGRKGNRNRRRRPGWLWREVAGFLPSTKRFIYVSDGGHLDNLGLLELLRRRSQVILIVDASADTRMTTNTLDGVCELAESHLGIAIERDPTASPLNTGPEPSSVTLSGVADDCVEVAPIKYSELPDSLATADGLLIVAKARFTKDLLAKESLASTIAAITDSHRGRLWPWSMRTLPTTVTANQWLTDDQFAGYIELGKAVGERAVAELTVRHPEGPRAAPVLVPVPDRELPDPADDPLRQEAS